MLERLGMTLYGFVELLYFLMYTDGTEGSM